MRVRGHPGQGMGDMGRNLDFIFRERRSAKGLRQRSDTVRF